MPVEPPSSVRERAVAHVLAETYPTRQTASVVGATPTDSGWLVGVKAHPRGYLSTASYALLTVDEMGTVRAAERCDRRDLDRRLPDD